MKNINFILIVFIFTVVAFSNNVPDNITQLSLKALEGDLNFFNSKSFEKRKKIYGFNESTRISDLKVGTPVKVYSNFTEEFLDRSGNTPLNLSNYDYDWYCPVIENGEIRLFFIIKKQGNEWVIDNSGGLTTLATEWQKVIKSWPYSEGYNPVILLVCGYSYFHVPEKDDRNITLINTYNKPGLLAKKSSNNYGILKYEAVELKNIKRR